MRVYNDEIGNHELKMLHDVMLEILNDLTRVCEENNLKYYLIGGTLLGAIRHKGFIPWDDDMDVVMPRSDYEKFINIVTKEKDSKFFFYGNETTPDYWTIFGKYRKKGTEICENSIAHLNVNKSIFIDIFPLDECSDKNSNEIFLRMKIVKFIDKCRQLKVRITSSFNKKSKKLCRFLLIPFPNSFLSKIQKWIMTKENGKGYKFYVNFGSNYNINKVIYPIDFFGEGEMVLFEGKYYRAPKEWEKILTTVYNNYNELPPIDKREPTHKPIYIDFGE